MLEGAFGAATDGRASSDLAEARIGTRRPRRRVARLERRVLVRPHGRMPVPRPLAAYSCRFRSRLATWPGAGARRRQSPLPADDTRHCTTARRFGLPPVSARWKRQLLETRQCSSQIKARAAPALGSRRWQESRGFGGSRRAHCRLCEISPIRCRKSRSDSRGNRTRFQRFSRWPRRPGRAVAARCRAPAVERNRVTEQMPPACTSRQSPAAL